MTAKQIEAKIAILKAKIELLEAEKKKAEKHEELIGLGYSKASDLARHLNVSRQYISNNKYLYDVLVHEGREYYKKRNPEK